MKAESCLMWKGTPVNELSRDQMVEVIKWSDSEMRRMRASAARLHDLEALQPPERASLLSLFRLAKAG